MGRFSLQLYFPTNECEEFKAATRTIPATSQVADQALRLLFAGPSESEKKQGLTHIFEPLAWFKKGVAVVDFKPEAMSYLNSTACVRFSVKGSIEKTLKQFPDINQVEYAIDGQVVEEWDA